MVIGKSVNTAPVHRSRCSRTQQLSGPTTEAKRCVTFQAVEAAGGVNVEVDDGEDGADDEHPEHAASSNAKRTAKRVAIKTRLLLAIDARRGHGKTSSGLDAAVDTLTL
ncbi:MAG TPA: hypothetical protein VEL51_13785 [Vicinamibacterales bacterium]|nr:hypothetical protein [Vicinamibacterales bacterium]